MQKDNDITSDDIKSFLVRSLGLTSAQIKYHDTEDYIIIEILNARHGSIIRGSVTVYVYLPLLNRMIPRTSRRLREIIAINKVYGIPDAFCILYAKQRWTRLMCTGRPEPVRDIMNIFKPNALTTIPWNPIIMPECRNKRIIEYRPNMKSYIYICVLR